MQGLYSIICIILIIIQIYLVVNFKKSSDSKYWNIFMGITIANFFSTNLAYITFLLDDSLDLGRGVLCMLVCGFSFVSNLILLIVGEKIKNNLKNENIRLNTSAIFTGLLIMILMLLILVVIPVITNKMSNILISNKVITYLTNKYGDNNYEIVDIKNSYSYNGIIEKHHSGYKVTVSSTLLKNNFIVTTGGTQIGTDFIQEYYNEKTNEYLLQKYDVKFDIWTIENSVSNTCGHIPTFNELVDYNAIKYIFIMANINRSYNYEYNEDKRIDYIKELSFDLIKYLNISRNIDNIKIEFKRSFNNYNSYLYNLQILNSTLIITSSNNDKVYEFDISGLNVEE